MDVAAAPTNVGARVEVREGIALIVLELWAHQVHVACEMMEVTLANVVARYFSILVTTNVSWCPMATKHQNFQSAKDVGIDGTSAGTRVEVEVIVLNVLETKAHKVHVASEVTGATLLNVQELPSAILVTRNVFW